MPCDTCAYFAYDEDDECYYCTMDMDEDDYARIIAGIDTYGKCPYYRNGDEYAVVRHQI